VKAAEDAYAPVSGKVLELNADLESNPEWVNQDPYGKAWMARLAPSNPKDLESLMNAEEYEKFVQAEEEAGAH
jgi:glycine cleavage system H protein